MPRRAAALGYLGQHHHQRPDLVGPKKLVCLVFGMLAHVGRRWARPIESVRLGKIWDAGVPEEGETFGSQGWVMKLKVDVEGSHLCRDNSAESTPVVPGGLWDV